MSSSIVSTIRRILGAGEVVTIAYNGGRKPGEPRSVVPQSISTDALVATEPGASVSKTYRLDLIAWVELSSGQRVINPAVLPPAAPKPPARVIPDIPQLPTLAAYVEHYRAELIATGWHLYEAADSFGVGSRFKSGKPKATPSIWLRYFPPSAASVTPRIESIALVLSTSQDGDLVTDLERTEKPAPPARPWRLDSWRLPTGKTFVELQPAFAFFIDEVRHSEPATAKSAFSAH